MGLPWPKNKTGSRGDGESEGKRFEFIVFEIIYVTKSAQNCQLLTEK
jgi:hypothetical protein